MSTPTLTPERKFSTDLQHPKLSSPRPRRSSPLARKPPIQCHASTPSSTLSDSSHLSTSSESSDDSDPDPASIVEISSPKIALKDRLSMFLPQLAASNADLDAKRAMGEELNAGFEISAESAEDVEGAVQTGVGGLERDANAAESVRCAKRRRLVREVEPGSEDQVLTNVEEDQAGSGQQELEFEQQSEEDEGETRKEPYIEMNLDLGVLEGQKNEGSSSDESSEEDNEPGKPVLDKLMHVGKVGKKRRTGTHPAILEV